MISDGFLRFYEISFLLNLSGPDCTSDDTGRSAEGYMGCSAKLSRCNQLDVDSGEDL